VHFLSDGLPLTVAEQSALLAKLAASGLQRDHYLAGGATAALEARFARELGKEKALFLPTGTLANHLALRCLAGEKTRVIVQAESHIYRDSLDCVQTLSHLNLVPLAPGKATVTLAEIEATCQEAVAGPFPTPVGAISIESPVRRRQGEAVDFKEMKRVSAYARQKGIRLHLDGARLFVVPAYTGLSVAEYAALFDTVYISLYKCFNAGSGAILAGPAEVIGRVAHARKVFGAGMYQAWPYAAVAAHYLDGYIERFAKAVGVAKEFFGILILDPRLSVERPKAGTNVYHLRVKDIDAGTYQKNLAAKGVRVGRPSATYPGVQLVVNESWGRIEASEMVKPFIEALDGK
jgi:threonine aldolase